MSGIETLFLVAAATEATSAAIALIVAFYALVRNAALERRVEALEERFRKLEATADYRQVAALIAHQEAIAIGYQEKWARTHAQLVAERAVRATEQ